MRHSLNDLLCYFSKIFLSNCCHICKYVTYINDKCITDHLLLSRPKIGTENMNMNEIEPPPLRALWFHFEDKMDYNTVR